MPKEQQKYDTPRQRPVSCRLCRTRKLRCNREAPCSNCVSRGVRCELRTPIAHTATGLKTSESDILERINRLEELLSNQKPEQPKTKQITGRRNSDSSKFHEQLSRPSASSPHIQGMTNVVDWLEGIHTGYDLSVPSSKFVLRICPIQQIKDAKTHIYQNEFSPAMIHTEPLRCIWLPQYPEAQMLVEKYLRDVDHIQHVIHAPSLSSIIQEVYTNLNQQCQVKPGHLILLLGMCASASYSWMQHDCDSGLFFTSAEANAQALVWIRAIQDVLDIAYRSASISIEGIQGIIIVMIVLADLEGFSRRLRSLYSTALFLARDLQLHRIDHPTNASLANTVQAEIGRRLWWYICATDWSMAGLTGITKGVYSCHLRQMITRKPLNINDEDVCDGMRLIEKPSWQPTIMSYTLLRIRLAEISRNVVDRAPLMMANLDSSTQSDVIDIDTELQMLINDVPSFFSMSKAKLMEEYGLSPSRAVNILHQGYLFHSFIYSQRCRLHLPYFTRGFFDPEYSLSREMCVKSARLIIQSESWIESSGCRIATRFRFCMLLKCLFMASIVLLMDLSVREPSLKYKKQREEVSEAFRILEEAKQVSEAASKLVESLMLILEKNKLPRPNCGPPLQPSSRAGNDTAPIVAGGRVPCYAPETRVQLDSRVSLIQGASSIAIDGNYNHDINVESEGSSDNKNTSSYLNEFALNFEQEIDFNNFNWDDIFSGLDSSFI